MAKIELAEFNKNCLINYLYYFLDKVRKLRQIITMETYNFTVMNSQYQMKFEIESQSDVVLSNNSVR